MKLHHIAIRVPDLATSIPWYCDYFKLKPTWSVDRLNHVTTGRLPGIEAIAELGNRYLKLHLLHCPQTGDAVRGHVAFQHICLQVKKLDDIAAMRERWLALYNSNNYRFALPEQPSEIVVEEDGSRNFYFLDIHGNEFELAYVA